MDICTGRRGKFRFDHDEVVFTAANCPVCEKQYEVEALQKEIESLSEQVNELEAQAEL